MAKNLASNGHTINVVAGGDVVAGDVADIGDLIGVALNSGASGDTIVYALTGVWDIPGASGEAYTLGEEVGVTANEAVKAGTGSYAMEGTGTGPATVAIMINGMPGS